MEESPWQGWGAGTEAEALPGKRKLDKHTYTVLANGEWAKEGTSHVTRSRSEGGIWGENLRHLQPIRNRPQRQGRCRLLGQRLGASRAPGHH